MLSIAWLALTGVIATAAPAAGTQPAPPEDVRAAVQRGRAFLIRTQNRDGSWGGAADSITTWSGGTWSNPESHRAWRVATSGLCCLALLEADDAPEARAALDRGLDYLCKDSVVKRPNEWDTMGCWAFVYGLQAVAAAYGDARYADAPRRPELRRAAADHLRQLAYHQSLSGGWGYLEFDEPRTARPQWATSFTTGAGVVALLDARAAGVSVDEAMLARAVRAVRWSRLPSGAYSYSVSALPRRRVMDSVDDVKGSLSRIQTCNLALLMAGQEMPVEQLRAGLQSFFREHRFLDIAVLKPVPHESFYANSGYFYLFGHYYAARVIEQLSPAERRVCWPRLQHELLKMQQADGAWWDYDHHAYDKAYGTAYALLALQRSLRDTPR